MGDTLSPERNAGLQTDLAANLALEAPQCW